MMVAPSGSGTPASPGWPEVRRSRQSICYRA